MVGHVETWGRHTGATVAMVTREATVRLMWTSVSLNRVAMEPGVLTSSGDTTATVRSDIRYSILSIIQSVSQSQYQQDE